MPTRRTSCASSAPSPVYAPRTTGAPPRRPAITCRYRTERESGRIHSRPRRGPWIRWRTRPIGATIMSIRELFAYLCVADTAAAIRFYERAFGATEKFRLTEPGGRIGHAEIDLGGHTLMLC